MSEQYYTREPQSQSHPHDLDFTHAGHSLRFVTDSGVFSKSRLDPGTALLLSCLPEHFDSALDLGCGWGAVGVALKAACPEAQVTMVDVNLRALELALHNLFLNQLTATVLESDGFSALPGDARFDLIAFNPPIRAGKEVIYRLFAESAQHLTPGGALQVVIRKQQGAESALRYLSTQYAAVDVATKKSGYWVLVCKK